MATTHQRQTIQEYLNKMDEHVDVRKWKAIKVIGIAAVFGAVYYFGVDAGADPAGRLLWACVGGILLASGVELTELELLYKLKNASITVGVENGEESEE